VKPHALQHLIADVTANKIEIVILVETWMKTHHSDQAVEIPGYTIFRRDRKKRRGGGVAIYAAKNDFKGSILQFSDVYTDSIELLWVSIIVRGRLCYIGAVYHLSKAIYPTTEMNSVLQQSLENICSRNTHLSSYVGTSTSYPLPS
jgi:hypothetical protein